MCTEHRHSAKAALVGILTATYRPCRHVQASLRLNSDLLINDMVIVIATTLEDCIDDKMG